MEVACCCPHVFNCKKKMNWQDSKIVIARNALKRPVRNGCEKFALAATQRCDTLNGALETPRVSEPDVISD